MPAINPADFRNGMTVNYRDGMWTIINHSSRKMGRGAATYTAKMKNVETGQVLEDTFRAGEKLEQVILEEKPMQYLYQNGDKIVLMDPDTFEQPELSAEFLEGSMDLLREGDNVMATVNEGKFIAVRLHDFVELAVTEAPPHAKGDTANAEYRPVTLETGAEVKVPPFIGEGDVVQIDTRSREYVKRVTKG